MVDALPQAPLPTAHRCQPPTGKIGRWTCPTCGSGWLHTTSGRWDGAGPGWCRWSDADDVHLCAAYQFLLAAERLPWWAWRRRSRAREYAATARAQAGHTW